MEHETGNIYGIKWTGCQPLENNLHATQDEEISIKIGKDTISKSEHAKLLGMTFNEEQYWTGHVQGTGGLISKLNQKIFLLRRLKNCVDMTRLEKWLTVYSILKFGVDYS